MASYGPQLEFPTHFPVCLSFYFHFLGTSTSILVLLQYQERPSSFFMRSAQSSELDHDTLAPQSDSNNYAWLCLKLLLGALLMLFEAYASRM